MKRPLCPILLIGFPAPEKGEEDIRRCAEECALFNKDRDICSIVATNEILEEMIAGMYGYEPDPYYGADEYYAGEGEAH